jgi:predicted enzyme related to lactoylglutathione lyase
MFMVTQDDWKLGRDRVKGAGFRMFCSTSQDVDRLAAGIKARGGTLDREPTDEWGMRTFAITDPDGFKITIGRIPKR